jgi:hypothetical protein
MKSLMATFAALLALTASATGAAADAPWSFDGVKSLWEKNRDSQEYRQYAAEFTKYVNYYHIDKKGECYALSPGPVELFLVIANSDDGKFAEVQHVLASVDNEKSRCFQNTYLGLRVRVPPSVPYPLELEMK